MEKEKFIIYSKTYELEASNNYEDMMFGAAALMLGCIQEDIKEKNYEALNNHLEMLVCSAQNLNMFANNEIKKKKLKEEII